MLETSLWTQVWWPAASASILHSEHFLFAPCCSGHMLNFCSDTPVQGIMGKACIFGSVITQANSRAGLRQFAPLHFSTWDTHTLKCTLSRNNTPLSSRLWLLRLCLFIFRLNSSGTIYGHGKTSAHLLSYEESRDLEKQTYQSSVTVLTILSLISSSHSKHFPCHNPVRLSMRNSIMICLQILTNWPTLSSFYRYNLGPSKCLLDHCQYFYHNIHRHRNEHKAVN